MQSSKPLHLLFLATRDYYDPATTGGDITMWEYARYLASVGHSVTYLARRYPGALPVEDRDGMHVVRLGHTHTLWLHSLRYYLKRGRGSFDVVVTEGFGGSRIPRLAPLYVREPIVSEWHQIHRELFAAQYPAAVRPLLNMLERATSRIHRNTFIRAGTVEWQEAFPRLGFKPENIFVVPVSITDDWFALPRPPTSQEPLILWIGKFRKYKRPDHVVRAMQIVAQSVPAARLLLAGRHDDGPYEHDLMRLARTLGVHEKVTMRLDVPEAEKRALIDSARVLVVPSSVEGFGVVILEANARGVPVVASSRVPTGAVETGRNGLRYEFANIPELAQAITRLLSDDELHGQLAQRSIEFAKGFRWQDVGARYEHEIQRIAAAQ